MSCWCGARLGSWSCAWFLSLTHTHTVPFHNVSFFFIFPILCSFHNIIFHSFFFLFPVVSICDTEAFVCSQWCSGHWPVADQDCFEISMWCIVTLLLLYFTKMLQRRWSSGSLLSWWRAEVSQMFVCLLHTVLLVSVLSLLSWLKLNEPDEPVLWKDWELQRDMIFFPLEYFLDQSLPVRFCSCAEDEPVPRLWLKHTVCSFSEVSRISYEGLSSPVQQDSRIRVRGGSVVQYTAYITWYTVH